MNEPIRHPDAPRETAVERASTAGTPGRLDHASQLVDRDCARRKDPDLLAELAADPRARVMRISRGAVAVRAAEPAADAEADDEADAEADDEACAEVPTDLWGVVDAPVRLALDPIDAAVRAELDAAVAAETAAVVYLGLATLAGPEHDAGAPVLALIDEAHATQPDDAELVPLRALLGRLAPLDHELATTATAMREWHRAHAWSPASGDPLEIGEAGWLRQDRHGSPSFPRTDAAIIAAVVDPGHGTPETERILLGSNAKWSRRRFSLLAGFVEPGESFEQAVEREIAEESGIRIANPRYVGSQPWPFPASIMVGFLADLHPEQDPAALVPEPGEIDELRWLTRAELEAGAVELPPPPTIARRIIDGWLRGDLR